MKRIHQTVKRRVGSFRNAFEGLLWAVKTQPNFALHIVLSFIAIVLGWYLQVFLVEWILITVIITLGLVIELINTAIEATTDAIDKRFRDDIKIAKDVSAAAMLVYACGAATAAFLIFGPRLMPFFLN